MKKYLFTWVITIIIYVLVVDVLAQTGNMPSKFNFNLSGIVREKGSGETLPNATIILRYLNQGTSTNVDGYFTLFSVPTDTTTIEVSYVGYKSLTLKLNSKMDLESLLIELEEITIELSEVVVSAYDYNIMNASERISSARLSPNQLSLLPVVGEEDIFRSLQLLPGVSGTNESSSGLFVRGGTPDQNLVLLKPVLIITITDGNIANDDQTDERRKTKTPSYRQTNQFGARKLAAGFANSPSGCRHFLQNFIRT